MYYEPFHSPDEKTKMYIGPNELEIEEENRDLGIRVGDYNIKLFFDLIQTDGCNPLVIRPYLLCKT